MPNQEETYRTLLETCRMAGAQLVVVSKTRSLQEISPLYDMGQRMFAENRAQELVARAAQLPPDVEWHLIGHLQTNKVRSIIPIVHCIQSLDSIKLWRKIDEEASAQDTIVSCLLQIKIAAEESKYGWAYEDLYTVLNKGEHKNFPHVRICGVMGMSTLTDDQDQIRLEMRKLREYFEELNRLFYSSSPDFKTISMGMSGDYQIALEEGSTMVRVGSLLFRQTDFG